MVNNMLFQSIKTLAEALQRKDFSSSELIQDCLNKIEKTKTLNAFITLNAEQAQEEAKKADLLLSKGKASLLTGIPMAHKDVFCTKDTLTTCGSKMLHNFKPPYSATIVNKLAQQGAITIGKTNMDDLQWGHKTFIAILGQSKILGIRDMFPVVPQVVLLQQLRQV